MQNLFGVYFFNSTTGWAVGDTGTILKATTTTTAASISINISNGLSYNSLLELFVTGQYAFERIVEIAANSINYLNLNISYFVNVVTRNQYTIPVYLRIDPNQRQNVLTDIPGYGIALNGQNYISATIPNGAEYDIIFEVIDGNQAGFQNSPQAGDKAQRPIPVIAGNSGGGVDNEIKKSELALTEIDKILIQLTNHKQW
jgi:hypothetical protein